MNGFFAACQFPHFAYGNQNWILSPTIKSVLTHMEMTGKSGVNNIYAGAEHRGPDAEEFRRKFSLIHALGGNEDGGNAD